MIGQSKPSSMEYKEVYGLNFRTCIKKSSKKMHVFQDYL